MKNKSTAPGLAKAFTLVELLTVIAIIAVLAAMLLPVLSTARNSARKSQTRSELQGIVNAVEAYDSQYSRFPVTTDEQAFANASASDFTTGLFFTNQPPSYDINSNVVAILMDATTFPNGNPTPDSNHVLNPSSIKFLNVKMSGYDPTHPIPKPPGGVDNTGVYRDPWGNPYIISMDLNYDENCQDQIYGRRLVSQNGANSQAGFYGLSNTNSSARGNTDRFVFQGKVMAWSAGPDGQYSATKAANISPNKDNILSWQ